MGPPRFELGSMTPEATRIDQATPRAHSKINKKRVNKFGLLFLSGECYYGL